MFKKNIKELYHGCSESLPTLDTLSGLPNLEYLNLHSIYLKENSLDGLPKLRQITLIVCNMYSLKPDVFESMPSLKSLIIETYRFGHTAYPYKHIRISSIESLERLVLRSSDNRLKVLLNLPHELRVLELRELANSEKCSPELRQIEHSKLEILDLKFLSTNYFQTKWLDGLTNLKHLRIFDSYLKHISLSSQVIQKLTSLSLESNKIERLNWCALVNLTSLDLSNNKELKFDSNMFESLVKLEQLHLRSVEFDGSVENVFFNLESLCVLDLRNNRIKKIDRKVFQGPVNLRELSLNMNEFETFEAKLILEMFSKLKRLDLNDCKISNKLLKRISDICEDSNIFDRVQVNF